ncbi:hypothetical protein A4A49_63410, partial [Nicotiana attenuata]
MHVAPPSGDEKPPDQSKKMRNSKAYKPPLGASLKHSPTATNLKIGGAITVAKNRLGASKISKGDSWSNLKIPSRRDHLSSQSAPPHQKSDHSTVGIAGNDDSKNDSFSEMADVNVPAVQMENESRPGVRRIDSSSSEPIGEKLAIGISSPTSKEPPCKISAHSTMGIDNHDHSISL